MITYQGGAMTALVTLHERFYSNWRPHELVDVGATVFFDVDRTCGPDTYAGESLGWLKDAGAGLRLGSVRSGPGNVLDPDVAFPMEGERDIDGKQFIETRRSF